MMKNCMISRRPGLNFLAVVIFGVFAVFPAKEDHCFGGIENEYLSQNRQFDHWVIQADFLSEEGGISNNTFPAESEKNRPISLISVPVPSPGVIILICCGGCIIKWLRSRNPDMSV